MAREFSPLHNLLQFCLTLVVTSALASPRATADPAIKLDILLSGQWPQVVSVSCSLDPNLTSLVTVESLTVYGPGPASEKGDLQALASVDRWSGKPFLFHRPGTDSIHLDGFFGSEDSKSELSLTWTSPSQTSGHRFKCSAQGTDRFRQMVTISELVKMVTKDAPQFCHARNIDSLSSKVDHLAQSTTGVNNTMNNLDHRMAQIEQALNASLEHYGGKCSQNMHTMMQSVSDKIDSKFQELDTARGKNSTDVSSLLTGVHTAMTLLQQTIEGQAARIRHLEARALFEVSDLFKGKRYLVSRREETFNIQAADASCGEVGGYLVEIDDQEELDFVVKFLKRVGGATYFATGTNDIDTEDQFVFYHSKRPVTFSAWYRGEPNNVNDEDCAGIHTPKKGLIDIPCSFSVKFVCEARM